MEGMVWTLPFDPVSRFVTPSMVIFLALLRPQQRQEYDHRRRHKSRHRIERERPHHALHGFGWRSKGSDVELRRRVRAQLRWIHHRHHTRWRKAVPWLRGL